MKNIKKYITKFFYKYLLSTVIDIERCNIDGYSVPKNHLLYGFKRFIFNKLSNAKKYKLIQSSPNFVQLFYDIDHRLLYKLEKLIMNHPDGVYRHNLILHCLHSAFQNKLSYTFILSYLQNLINLIQNTQRIKEIKIHIPDKYQYDQTIINFLKLHNYELIGSTIKRK